MIQWLGICLVMQGTRVQSLIWEDPICLRAPKPMSCNYGDPRAPQQKEPPWWEVHALQQRPNTTKHNINLIFLLSHFSCVWPFVTPWNIACQASLSMRFSRPENWSGLPCPSPGDLPDPGIKPGSLMSPALAGRFLALAPLGSPIKK